MLRGEFNRRVEALGLDEETKQKLIKIFEEAGAEYPCLLCTSNDDCENFKWFLKWFSNKVDNDPF